jgi:hypothetical protein
LNRLKATARGVVRATALGLLGAAWCAAAPSFAQVDAGAPADAGSFGGAGALGDASPLVDALVPCPAAGFDLCFPDLSRGAPSATCDAPRDAGARVVDDCLGGVCGGVETEPVPGFFEYCCALGGSERYDDFCAFVVQMECSAVAQLCVGRCPPLPLLTGTVPIAPPPPACLADYPRFVTRVCQMDPFCCSTSWDSICAAEALEAEALEALAAEPPAASSN